MLIRSVFCSVILGIILSFSAAAFSQGAYATCPRDGEQAQRTNVEQIHSGNCSGDLYNAERDTYSHDHLNPRFMEHHEFTKITCLR